MEERLWCGALNGFCDRSTSGVGKCGGDAPLNFRSLAQPCEHAKRLAESKIGARVQGGDRVFSESLSEKLFRMVLFRDGSAIYLLDVNSGRVIEKNSRTE